MKKREANLPVPLHYQPRSDEIVCVPDAEGQCITCSDEALPAQTISIDQAMGLAQVMLNNEEQEVDITLVEEIAPGDWLLVHGGVAIARLPDEAHTNEAHYAR
jgi:hydrogenase assembly chaperone HypC/HupF